MFNLSFYAVYWLLFFLLCLPIIFAGLLAVASDSDIATPKKTGPLTFILNEIDKKTNDKEALKALLEEFMRDYKNYSKNEKEYKTWLDIISHFASNMNLMEIDEVVNFQDSLESANSEEQADIKEVIGRALQKRQGNQKE